MMTAVRLTNNDRCVSRLLVVTTVKTPLLLLTVFINQCVGSIEVPLGQSGALQPICVVDSNNVWHS